MSEYLYRITFTFNWRYNGKDKSPVYAVAKSKTEVKKYIERHMKDGAEIKTISLCGERLGMNMYHGKPKRDSKAFN